MEGTVTADTFIIDAAQNATFDTTVANLSVNGVMDQATIINDGDLNLLSGTTPGYLDVMADTITLADSDVVAGNAILTAESIIVDGAAQVTATKNDIAFVGDVTGNGTLTATADNTVGFMGDVTQDGRLDLAVRGDVAEFNGAVEVGFIDVATVSQAQFESTLTATESDPTNVTNHSIRIYGGQVFLKDDVTATAEGSKIQIVADELMLGGDVTGAQEIDFVGALTTVLTKDGDTTLTAETVRLSDVTIDTEGDAMLVVEGDAELNGDIYANGVTVNGSTTLKGDVEIFAENGNITLGKEVASAVSEDADIVSGYYNLVLKADDVTVNGNMSVGSLAIDANGDVAFPTKFASLYADRDIAVRATGDITMASYTNAGGDIFVSGNSVKIGETTSFTGDITVQSDTELTADRKITAKRGNVTLDANGDLSVEEEVTAYRNVTLSGANVTATDATITTTAGDVIAAATDGTIDFSDENSAITAGTSRYIMSATEDIKVKAITTAIIDSKFEAGKNVELDAADVIVSSIGTAGVPGAGLIMLTMVLTSVGLPIEGIALVAGIDAILDAARTSLNVTGDTAVCAVVAATEGETLNS